MNFVELRNLGPMMGFATGVQEGPRKAAAQDLEGDSALDELEPLQPQGGEVF